MRRVPQGLSRPPLSSINASTVSRALPWALRPQLRQQRVPPLAWLAPRECLHPPKARPAQAVHRALTPNLARQTVSSAPRVTLVQALALPRVSAVPRALSPRPRARVSARSAPRATCRPRERRRVSSAWGALWLRGAVLLAPPAPRAPSPPSTALPSARRVRPEPTKPLVGSEPVVSYFSQLLASMAFFRMVGCG